MKNFSDITDINLEQKLKIQIEFLEHNNPVYLFKLNGLPIQKIMHLGLLDHLHFSCLISQGAIEIVKICVNTKEILPLYLNRANPPTNWITQNWQFNIDKPFYPWYHEITGQGWTA
jgi:hypothetical protein